MRFLFLLLVGAWWRLSVASQAPTPPLTPEPAVLVGTYRLTYQIDSTNPAKRSDILYLLLGKTLSKFESRGEQAADSLLTIYGAMPINQETVSLITPQILALTHSHFHYTIYKMTASRQVYHYDRIATTRYRYEEPANSLNWTITPATATVAGYACQRATASYGGRQWEAWFTREIPVSDGPYKFYGLPRLIVKVGDTRQHYVFELAQLRKLPAPVAIALPEAGAKPIAKTDFVRGKAEYDRNAFSQMMASGSFRFNSPEEAEAAKQKSRERAKKRNNPLEMR